MAVTVEDLIAQTRRESGLKNNQFYTDTDIITFLTEGYHDLRDMLVIRFAHWFKRTYEFSLAGGESANSINMETLVPDFQMAQGLDLNLGSSVTPDWKTVDQLASFAERNQMNGIWPSMASVWSFNGFIGRKFWIDGDTLEVLPAGNAQGNYRLVYTPIGEPLAEEVTRTFDIETDDSIVESLSQWNLQNAAFTADDVGMSLTIAGMTGDNTDLNGTYTITVVNSATQCETLEAPSHNGVNPLDGTATVHGQPAGTIGELPEKLTPWARYLVLYASMVIRNGRGQSTAGQETEFNRMQARVIALTKQRSETTGQAPVTRGYRRAYYG